MCCQHHATVQGGVFASRPSINGTGWLGFGGEQKKLLPLLGIEPQPSSPWPVVVPTEVPNEVEE
jgi:hypothetical protein